MAFMKWATREKYDFFLFHDHLGHDTSSIKLATWPQYICYVDGK